MIEHTVDPNFEGQRIDNYLLRSHKTLPKSLLYKFFRKRAVKVNKKRVKQDYRVLGGDKITLPNLELNSNSNSNTQSQSKPKPNLPLDQWILFESKEYLILNKPSGLAVHGGSGQSFGLIEAVRDYFKYAEHWELCHRLDRDTSGCIVIAKKRSALKHFHELLQNRSHKIQKKYQCIVMGKWPENIKSVNAPLFKTHSGVNKGHFVKVDEKLGKPALTEFKVLKYLNINNHDITLLDVLLKTGRTHQIRVHTQYTGYPIIGDVRYSRVRETEEKLNLKKLKLCLHASSICFATATGDEILAEASVPEQWLLDII